MKNSSVGTGILLCTVAAIGLFPTSAHAQDNENTVISKSPDKTATDLGEIVVTAQRREQSARDVPISISAFSGEQLQNAGVKSTVDLSYVTPGLIMDKIGAVTLPAIRGVTTQASTVGGDANVAIYLDGVYQPNAYANSFSLADIERIEVLKGPQGTLFGRNATGGAIQIITRNPSYDFNGSFTASYGNLDSLVAKGFASIPLVDQKVALSISGYYEENDGYYRDVVTDRKIAPLSSRVIRGKVRLDPVENLNIILTGYYSKFSDASTLMGTSLNGNTIANLYPGSIVPTKPYDVAANMAGPAANVATNYGFSGDVKLDLGSGVLRAVTALNRYRVNGKQDPVGAFIPNAIGVEYPFHSRDKSFSEELTFSSDLEGRFNFTAGLFYINGYGAWDPLLVNADAYQIAIYGKQRIKSLAGFGEVYFDVSDRLHLILGGRYSWEKRSLGTNLSGVGAPKPSLNPLGKKSWKSFTPRAAIRYDLSPSANVYLSFSRGFKSGIFTTTALSLNPDGSNPVVDPEKITAYEVGFKGRIGDWLSLNAAGFYYDYTNLQVNSYQCVPAGDPNCVPLAVLQNAASARIYGLDFSGVAQLGNHFQVEAGVSILDPKFKRFPNANVTVPATDSMGIPTNTGNVAASVNANGNHLIRAPRYTLTVTPSYMSRVFDGELRISATLYHSARIYYTFDERISQKPYTTVDARVGWTSDHSGVSFAAFGRNLTNVTRASGTFVSEISDQISYASPRTYGVEIGYRF